MNAPPSEQDDLTHLDSSLDLVSTDKVGSDDDVQQPPQDPDWRPEVGS